MTITIDRTSTLIDEVQDDLLREAAYGGYTVRDEEVRVSITKHLLDAIINSSRVTREWLASHDAETTAEVFRMIEGRLTEHSESLLPTQRLSLSVLKRTLTQFGIL